MTVNELIERLSAINGIGNYPISTYSDGGVVDVEIGDIEVIEPIIGDDHVILV